MSAQRQQAVPSARWHWDQAVRCVMAAVLAAVVIGLLWLGAVLVLGRGSW